MVVMILVVLSVRREHDGCSTAERKYVPGTCYVSITITNPASRLAGVPDSLLPCTHAPTGWGVWKQHVIRPPHLGAMFHITSSLPNAETKTCRFAPSLLGSQRRILEHKSCTRVHAPTAFRWAGGSATSPPNAKRIPDWSSGCY